MPFLFPLQLRDGRLAAAKRFIDTIVRDQHLSITKVIKRGPRFFVAEGICRHGLALLKICLFTRKDDNLTNEKFSREVLFLQYLQSSRVHRRLAAMTPHLIASGTAPRAWYLREYSQGKLQNVRGGNVRFRPSFFTQATLRLVGTLFGELQRIRAHELPGRFKLLLHTPDGIRKLMKFIKPYRGLIDRALGDGSQWKHIEKYLLANQDVYNSAPRVLVHQEPYAVHFIKHRHGWTLIDWENIGWGNPAHDYVVMWMRAAGHSRWQRALQRRVRRNVAYRHFDRLWEMEIVLQSCYNLISWYAYPQRKDMRALFVFSQQIIRSMILK